MRTPPRRSPLAPRALPAYDGSRQPMPHGNPAASRASADAIKGGARRWGRDSRESGNLLTPIPSFLRRQESIRRDSAMTGRKPRLHRSPGPRHSRESGNLLEDVIPAKAGTYPSPYRHSCVGRNPVGAIAPQTGRKPRLHRSPGPRHSRESGNLLEDVIPAYAGTLPPTATIAPCANAPSLRYDGSRRLRATQAEPTR